MNKKTKTSILTYNSFGVRRSVVGYNRTWSRAYGDTCMPSISTKELDMRRKAEILKYKGASTNTLTKAETYAQYARGGHCFFIHNYVGVLFNLDNFHTSRDKLLPLYK